MNEAFSCIQNVDTMLSQSLLVYLDSVAFASTTSAYGRGQGRGSGRGRGSRGGSDRDRYYHYCQKTNHLPEKCWVKFGKLDWAN